MFVVSHYKMYAIPVFDMTDTVLVKKLKFAPHFISRNLYVGKWHGDIYTYKIWLSLRTVVIFLLSAFTILSAFVSLFPVF